jgi:hypothetical protein
MFHQVPSPTSLSVQLYGRNGEFEEEKEVNLGKAPFISLKFFESPKVLLFSFVVF